MDKRVWVGIRVRPHSSSCLETERHRVVQTLGPASSASFFFDRVFQQDVRQEDLWKSLEAPMMRTILRHEPLGLDVLQN